MTSDGDEILKGLRSGMGYSFSMTFKLSDEQADILWGWLFPELRDLR